MKAIVNTLLFCLVIFLFSCGDNFLDRPPLDNITEELFWKNTQDMETYLNNFYAGMPGYPLLYAGMFDDDQNSDNMVSTSYNTTLAGYRTTPTTGSSLYYGNIRSINYFLEKSEETDIPDIEKNPYIGEGFYFRAWLYWDLLSSYGGVPWIDKVLTTSSPELYSSRADRSEIAMHILEDLDKAIEYLKPAKEAEPFRLNKEIALALKSRVALFEGSWEKYHSGSVFAASNNRSDYFFDQAMQAAKDIMDGKYGTLYQIYSTGNIEKDYMNLFNQDDLQNNPEILFWRKYSIDLKLAHNLQRQIGVTAGDIGITKALVDSYLCSNGRPIHNSDGLYKGDDLPYSVFENRDLRLRQLVFVKGDPITIENGDTIRYFERGPLHLAGAKYCPTGYQLKKGANPENTNKVQDTDATSITAYILFRYAEILLNYVEAKAELGALTQNDIDLTINTIRDRVGMAHLSLDNIAKDPAWDFPELSPIINEIRRERRIELACEGFRYNDLRRWRGDRLISGVKPLGIKFNQNIYPEVEVGKNVHLSADGYVEPYATSLPNGWQFNPERDYLSPLTLNELILNPNLKQNPGWETP